MKDKLYRYSDEKIGRYVNIGIKKALGKGNPLPSCHYRNT